MGEKKQQTNKHENKVAEDWKGKILQFGFK